MKMAFGYIVFIAAMLALVWFFDSPRACPDVCVEDYH